MNRIKPFFNGSRNDDVPECYNRVRYLREACKVFADLYKSDKDFLNKSVDNDISKAFKEFTSTDIARNYRSPYGINTQPSILNSTIDDLTQIHQYIDDKRQNLLKKFRTVTEQAREKQIYIRQTLTEPRENYERAVKKFETADSNLKKLINRQDRQSLPNYEERYRELEILRNDCEHSRTIARDAYIAETYRVASEEHSITEEIFGQYLFDEQDFYNDIQEYLSKRIPNIKRRLNDNKLAPAFACDLSEHCLKRIQRPIAYPIETCIRLLKDSIKDEGIFRIAPSQGKQKKFLAELELQMIDDKMTLQDLGYDAHVPASTLKQYLRELPECLLTDELIPRWNEVPSLSSEEARVQRISELINKLPKVNYDNLSYLIRFLSRIAEHSSENKMTPNNLGICIGCSLMYPKEQSSNSYINSSTIVELMILHSKQLFPNENQIEVQPATRSQPDIIPTLHQTKNGSSSNENLIDIQPSTDFVQPSPRPSGKHRAPPPPPTASSGLTLSFDSTHTSETSTEYNPFDEVTTPTTPSANPYGKGRRHSSGNTGSLPDRPQYRQRLSNYTKEENSSSSYSSKDDNDLLLLSSTSNDSFPFVKYIPDNHNGRLFNTGQTNTNRLSSSIPNTPNSPETGEITQF